MGKKKFDKKSAAHFQVVLRSKCDPLADDPSASQTVLRPIIPANMKSKPGVRVRAPGDVIKGSTPSDFGLFQGMGDGDTRIDEEYLEKYFPKQDELDDEDADSELSDDDERRYEDADEDEEEEDEMAFDVDEFGLPKDGYDYTQHMKAMGESGAKFIEAPEGMTVYMKQRWDKDPSEWTQEEKDVFEALDSDVEGYEELDDDFVSTAGTQVRNRDEARRVGLEMFQEEEEPDWGYDDDDYDHDAERRPRTEIEQVLDAKFERAFEEYEDDDIGELDEMDPTVSGSMTLEQFEDVLDDFLDSQVKERERIQRENAAKLDKVTVMKTAGLDEDSSDEDKPQKVVYEVVEVQEEDQWDCESILSTLSNTENHPRLIAAPPRKIKLGRHGIPVGVLPERAPQPPIREDEEESHGVIFSAHVSRKKDESAEERKARKKAVKEEQKANRQRKKQVKLQFKEEEKRVCRPVTTGDVRSGTSLIKIA